MASITLKNRSGGDAGTVDLSDAVFGIEPNVPVMHQVVTAQLAAKRSGTQSTKTRAEVRGGGAKPWKQKGTGRARAGSSRSPMWKGGGVALGPKPRSYAQKTPKKMIRLALRSALSDRAADDKVIVVDEWGFDAPRTKDAIAALSALGVEGRVLVVLDGDDIVTWKCFRNLPEVHLIEADQLNAYDVLVSDYVVFSRDTLPADTDATPAPAKAAKAKATPAAAETPAAEAKADLPSRPPADPAQKSEPVEATERVKSAADKPDPRFEAARQKLAKEDALRAKAAKAAAEAGSDAADPEGDAPASSGGFSFSNTDEAES
jgi:large subunit ribosomal protein L4